MAKATTEKKQPASVAALEQAVAGLDKTTPAKVTAPKAAKPAAAAKQPAAKAAAKPVAKVAAGRVASAPVAGTAVAAQSAAVSSVAPGSAVGMVETRGLVAAIEAADAMLKTAQVSLAGLERIGSGLVTVVVRGEVSAVTAAVARGGEAAAMLGEVVSTDVIARPVDELPTILPR